MRCVSVAKSPIEGGRSSILPVNGFRPNLLQAAGLRTEEDARRR
jgi:hypothetical protein